MKVEALFFDFDGVIADTETVWVDCIHQFCTLYGLNISRAELLNYLGDGDVMMLQFIASQCPENETQILDAIRSEFALRTRHLQMRPGIERYLHYAKSEGLKLALVSNSSAGYIDRWLNRLGIAACFDCIVTRDHDLPIKPAPDMYIRAVEQLQVLPECTIVIEDSVIGLRSALAAGLCAVAFPNESSVNAVQCFFPLMADLGVTPPHCLIRRVEHYYGGVS